MRESCTLDELASLTLRDRQWHPLLLGGEAALRKYFEKGLARDDHGVRVLRDDGGQLVAALAHWREPDAWFGVPTREVAFARRRDAAGTERWLCDTFDEAVGEGDAEVHAHVQVCDVALREHLVKRGYGVDAVILAGRVDAALEGLLAHADPPRDLTHLGLTVAPLEDPADVDAFTELSRQTFTAEPQWCWFGAGERFLEAQREALLEQIADPDTHVWRVVRQEGAFAGLFGASLDRDNVYWGPSAGMDLLLTPALRGRGILKTAYRLTLEALRARGIRCFRGGTSQPGVMHWARIMGRLPVTTTHRLGSPWALAYFDPLLALR